ncbi:uncharacterized protein LOC130613713 [Hydractinia symbiolongicarpus]|uniref:uncharacterized protein LOC130613713 n=1 Tax=Hydractinia symbiolongicarpus TaxID=13093 RepID=UPI00254F8C77|nr:uncharacterized protein LOC130613713 [Hydractinia symbiolongicarpus]
MNRTMVEQAMSSEMDGFKVFAKEIVNKRIINGGLYFEVKWQNTWLTSALALKICGPDIVCSFLERAAGQDIGNIKSNKTQGQSHTNVIGLSNVGTIPTKGNVQNDTSISTLKVNTTPKSRNIPLSKANLTPKNKNMEYNTHILPSKNKIRNSTNELKLNTGATTNGSMQNDTNIHTLMSNATLTIRNIANDTNKPAVTTTDANVNNTHSSPWLVCMKLVELNKTNIIPSKATSMNRDMQNTTNIPKAFATLINGNIPNCTSIFPLKASVTTNKGHNTNFSPLKLIATKAKGNVLPTMITSPVKGNTTPTKIIQLNTNTPSVKDNVTPTKGLQHNTNAPLVKDNTTPTKKLQLHTNAPLVKDNATPTKGLQHNTNAPLVKDNATPTKGLQHNTNAPLVKDNVTPTKGLQHNTNAPLVKDNTTPTKRLQLHTNAPLVKDNATPTKGLQHNTNTPPVKKNVTPTKRLQHNKNVEPVKDNTIPIKISTQNSQTQKTEHGGTIDFQISSLPQNSLMQSTFPASSLTALVIQRSMVSSNHYSEALYVSPDHDYVCTNILGSNAESGFITTWSHGKIQECLMKAAVSSTLSTTSHVIKDCVSICGESSQLNTSSMYKEGHVNIGLSKNTELGMKLSICTSTAKSCAQSMHLGVFKRKLRSTASVSSSISAPIKRSINSQFASPISQKNVPTSLSLVGSSIISNPKSRPIFIVPNSVFDGRAVLKEKSPSKLSWKTLSKATQNIILDKLSQSLVLQQSEADTISTCSPIITTTTPLKISYNNVTHSLVSLHESIKSVTIFKNHQLLSEFDPVYKSRAELSPLEKMQIAHGTFQTESISNQRTTTSALESAVESAVESASNVLSALYCKYCDKTFSHRRQFQYHDKTYCKRNKVEDSKKTVGGHKELTPFQDVKWSPLDNEPILPLAGFEHLLANEKVYDSDNHMSYTETNEQVSKSCFTLSAYSTGAATPAADCCKIADVIESGDSRQDLAKEDVNPVASIPYDLSENTPYELNKCYINNNSTPVLQKPRSKRKKSPIIDKAVDIQAIVYGKRRRKKPTTLTDYELAENVKGRKLLDEPALSGESKNTIKKEKNSSVPIVKEVKKTLTKSHTMGKNLKTRLLKIVETEIETSIAEQTSRDGNMITSEQDFAKTRIKRNCGKSLRSELGCSISSVHKHDCVSGQKKLALKTSMKGQKKSEGRKRNLKAVGRAKKGLKLIRKTKKWKQERSSNKTINVDRKNLLSSSAEPKKSKILTYDVIQSSTTRRGREYKSFVIDICKNLGANSSTGVIDNVKCNPPNIAKNALVTDVNSVNSDLPNCIALETKKVLIANGCENFKSNSSTGVITNVECNPLNITKDVLATDVNPVNSDEIINQDNLQRDNHSRDEVMFCDDNVSDDRDKTSLNKRSQTRSINNKIESCTSPSEKESRYCDLPWTRLLKKDATNYWLKQRNLASGNIQEFSIPLNTQYELRRKANKDGVNIL